MKKLYMRTIIGSSERDCVLIVLFQLFASKAGILEGSLLVYIGRRTTPILI